MNRADRKARNEEQASGLYDRLYCEEEDRQRAEWEGEFGKGNQQFPFKPNGAEIHRIVQKKMIA